MFTITKSQKNRDQIIHNNFIYEIKTVGTRRCNWRCVVKSCNVTASTGVNYQTDLNDFVVRRTHNHECDLNSVLKKIKYEEMKKLITTSNFSPRKIIARVLRGADLNLIRAMGSFDLLCRNLRRFRQYLSNPLPFLFPTLRLSEKLSRTHLNTQFFQYGIENFRGIEENDNIVIFYSDISIEKILNAEIIAVDGTFSFVPKPYMQLYSISVLKNHHVFPIVYAILKNKRFETYNALFRIIKNLIGNFSPRIIKTDFEQAAIQALKNNFPDSQISGCLFHLNQAIDRKVKENRLATFYSTSNTAKKFVRALSCLTFVKRAEIINMYNLLRAHSDFPTELIPVYDYFFQTYLGTNIVLYPLDVWHQLDYFERDIPRTNNAIEGWHNSFSSSFGSSRFSFTLMIEKLKDEEDFIRIKMIQMYDLGFVFERKKKYLEKEERLVNFLGVNRNNECGLSFIFDLVDILNY